VGKSYLWLPSGRMLWFYFLSTSKINISQSKSPCSVFPILLKLAQLWLVINSQKHTFGNVHRTNLNFSNPEHTHVKNKLWAHKRVISKVHKQHM